MICRRRGGWLAGLMLLASAAGLTGCWNGQGVRVADLAFEGNRAFSGTELAEALATRESGLLPWSERRYFDRPVFDADIDRLKAFYRDRGYPNLAVTAVDITFNDARDAVRLRVHLDEGEPIRVERIELAGIDALPADLVDGLGQTLLAVGAPLDRRLLAAAREQQAFLLHDSGYAHARVSSREETGSDPMRAVVVFEILPGPPTVFGDIDVVGLEAVGERVVRRSLAFRTGDPYRESQAIETQRRLSSLGLFDFAHVAEKIDPEGPSAPPVVPMVVTLAEGRPTRMQIGVGYGSEDGPRGSFQWKHLNFLGDARQFAADAKYSVRMRGAGLTYAQPFFLSGALSLSGQGGTWWASEPTYTSRSFGGRAALTWRAQSGRGRDIAPVEHVVRITYLNETLRYTIDEGVLADLTQFDELIALGLDPVTGKGSGRLAALSLDLERTVADRPSDPSSGYAVSFRAAHAGPALGGTFRYDEAGAEVRTYVPAGRAVVWASRARAGALFAQQASDVPFSGRHFLGGSSNLRGWGRYQVAPLTTDGQPIGGLAFLEFSTEARFPLAGSLGAVAFLDAGNVWSRPGDLAVRDLEVAVGPGLRLATPVGVLRADVGVQLTRIQGLLVNGEPERRRWRLHFSFGHTF